MNRSEKYVNKIINEIEMGKRTSPLKAIRAKCLDCSAYNQSEVRKCTKKNCPLFKFRFGKNETGT